MKFNRMELNAFDPDGVGVDNGTYFGLPFEPGTAELVLVSAPWDVTVSYGAGTAHAPDAVIEASTQLDFHEPLAPGVWRRGIATADVDYALLEESQRLRSDAEKVIAHLEGGGSPEDATGSSASCISTPTATCAMLTKASSSRMLRSCSTSCATCLR